MSRQAAWEQFSSDVEAMLNEVRERSELTEDEAMQLANGEVKKMRADRRERADH